MMKPILPNFCIYYRDMGATGNANAWIVLPDGSLREPSLFEQRKSYPEGWKHWSCADVDDLVLIWGKGCTAEPHRLEVRHRPATITQAQRDFADQLWPTLDERWEGKIGLVSKEPAPPLTKGWDLDDGPTAPVVSYDALLGKETRNFFSAYAEEKNGIGWVYVTVMTQWTDGLAPDGLWRKADTNECAETVILSNEENFYREDWWIKRREALKRAVKDGMPLAQILMSAKISETVKKDILEKIEEVLR